MPRVEIEPDPQNQEHLKCWAKFQCRPGKKWPPKIDVCAVCVRRFRKGFMSAIEKLPGIVQSRTLDHPSYADGVYSCAVCSNTLDEHDNS